MRRCASTVFGVRRILSKANWIPSAAPEALIAP